MLKLTNGSLRSPTIGLLGAALVIAGASSIFLASPLWAQRAALNGAYWLGQRGDAPAPARSTSPDGRKVLYYYDPMFPNQKFDKPGKSPFMDMQLEPKYADDAAGTAGSVPGVSIDPSAMQNLGIRVVEAKMGSLAATLNVTGAVDFNQRDVAIVQARSGGFVSRV